MAFTLAQLLTPQTKSDLTTSIVGKLNSAGVATSSWAPSAQGGIEMANVEAVSAQLATFAVPSVVTTTQEGALDLATGVGLELHALKRYGLSKRFAQPTIQTITLTVKPNAPSQDFGPGQVWVRSKAGRLYRNTDPVSIKPDPTLLGQDTVIRMPAACTDTGSAANQDVAGTIVDLVTPALPGVSASNPSPQDWTDAVVAGSYPGAGTVSLTGVPLDGVSVVKVRITTSGEPGGGGFILSMDGGRTWSPEYPLTSGLMTPNGITIYFNPGASRPSFVAGASYSFARADAIVQRGTDDETDEALRRRCRNRWPSLSEVPTRGLVDLWAHEASLEVDRVLVAADELHAGWMNVRMAAIDGMPSPGAIQAVQDFITARLDADSGGLEHASVSAVDVLQIAVVTTIFVPTASLPAVQKAAQAAWVGYLEGIPIGGQVLSSKFFELVMDAGAVDVDEPGTTFNGQASTVPFLQLGTVQVAQAAPGGLLAPSVVWSTV